MSRDPRGLSADEVRLRQQRDGPNRLPRARRDGLFAALREALGQPMVLLLVACATVYGALGSVGDALLLAGSLLLVMAISVGQSLRSQSVLRALRDMASPRSTVVRDGVVQRIASVELVVGDRLVVQEGDRLACDAVLFEAHGLRVDESLLTGESTPVDKNETSPRLSAGTLVLAGDGVAEVVAIGAATTLGRIGDAMRTLRPPRAGLRLQLDRIVRGVAWVAASLCAIAALLYGWRDGSWTAGLLVGLTLAMAIVPEEFAVVWSVMLALGAWRLARRQVLARQPQAVETLGCASVLCVDKTGTLTLNRMQLAAWFDAVHGTASPAGGAGPGPGAPVPEVLRHAALASVAGALEPMDQAILAGHPQAAGRVAWREGVQPGRPFVRQGWQLEGVAGGCVAIKGAPEAVLARCMDAAMPHDAIRAQAQAWAAQGWRVLAVAHARTASAGDRPDDRWQVDGLVAFQDPLRPEVPAALRRCRRAGVRVLMITGDAPGTATALAREAGFDLSGDGAVMCGDEIDALGDAALDAALAGVAVCARVTPAQKLRIVQGLQRRGEVVAMTGDGVNDGPALRAADVGVAMGRRGTDVAREAAALVLLDDRFDALVEAVSAGRRIHDNLRKAIGYLFAVHVPIVGLSLLPLLGGPTLLLPLHVVLLELLIDPACSLVFEAQPLAADAMRKPPRPRGQALFDRTAVMHALGVGFAGLLLVVAVQALARGAQVSDPGLRLAGLATVIAANLAMLQWFRRSPRALPAPDAAPS